MAFIRDFVTHLGRRRDTVVCLWVGTMGPAAVGLYHSMVESHATLEDLVQYLYQT